MWLFSWNEQIPWDTNSKAYWERNRLLELALYVLKKFNLWWGTSAESKLYALISLTGELYHTYLKKK